MKNVYVYQYFPIYLYLYPSQNLSAGQVLANICIGVKKNKLSTDQVTSECKFSVLSVDEWIEESVHIKASCELSA